MLAANYHSNLPALDLVPLVEALLEVLPDDPGSTVITVKSENLPPEASTDGQKAAHTSSRYQPSEVYVLEFCTVLALRDDDTVGSLGKMVMEALQATLRDASHYHAITVARAAYYALSLLKSSYVSGSSTIGDLCF